MEFKRKGRQFPFLIRFSPVPNNNFNFLRIIISLLKLLFFCEFASLEATGLHVRDPISLPGK
jgi:hypothetical protein